MIKTEESGKRPRYVWFIIMGSLLSSATWSSIVYGPTAVKSLGDFVEWCNRPPELSEIGQKINDMIDDEDGWRIVDRNELVYMQNGHTKFRVLKSLEYEGNSTYNRKFEFFTSPQAKNVSERLGKSELTYLVNRIKSLTTALEVKIKNAENAAILKELE